MVSLGRRCGPTLCFDSVRLFQARQCRSGSAHRRLRARPWCRADPTVATSTPLGADAAARLAIDTTLDAQAELSEIEIARAALAAVPAGGAFVVSSSMPVRDVEWFGHNRSDIDVYSNRGANGIDGVIATAIGVALSGRPTVCLIGDVAFLHDATSLTALAGREIDLSIVVTNNDGGGIFSFLPQHELLEDDVYEQLFGTPHETDLAAIATAHRLQFSEFSPSELAPSGVRIVMGRSDRSINLALHSHLVDEVGRVLDEQQH